MPIGCELSNGALKRAHVSYIWLFDRFLIGLNMIWCIYSGHVCVSCIFGTSEACKYAQECLSYRLCKGEVYLNIHFYAFPYKSTS